MIRALRLACVLLLPYLAYAETVNAKVGDVLDGDILVVDVAGSQTKVLLACSDCPEPGQPFAEEALQYSRTHALGQDVRIEVVKRARSGGIVGKVLLPGDVVLNDELIRAGLAWYSPKYDSHVELEEIATKVRADGVGLWSDHAPIPPWEFRDRQVSPKKDDTIDWGENSKPKQSKVIILQPDRPSSTSKAQASQSRDLLAEKDHVVFICNEPRKTYHKAKVNAFGTTMCDCKRLSKEYGTARLSEAVKAGYEPCFVCDPATE